MTFDAPRPEPSRARFLFRQEEGTIDALTWRVHAAWLLGLAIALTLGWLLLRPYARVDLKTGGRWITVVAFTYVIAYAFALILIAICYTMLSIKRMRDRRLPTGLAGLVPLLILLAGSLHFLRDQTPDVILLAYVVALDALLGVVIAWTVAQLGFGPSR